MTKAQAVHADYLVVEDTSRPTTWRLRIARNGILDRKLMLRAYARLTTGFAGRVYEGPKKSEAMAKLKAAAKRLNMNLRTGEAALATEAASPVVETEGQTQLVEDYGYDDDLPYVPWGVTDFDQLYAVEQVDAAVKEMRVLTYQFGEMANYISRDTDLPDPAQKIAALEKISTQFLALAAEALGLAVSDQPPVTEPATTEATGEVSAPAAGVGGEQLAETSAGVLELAEAEATDAQPLTMRVAIIRPGFGNSRDNHYYSAEMLRANADKFVGAKMFETDHVQAEKSTRTWVSTVKAISGFADDGSPVAEVVVHDPGFAARLRNLKAANMLERMECSILATGEAVAGTVDGKQAKVVKGITEVSSVDWVTRAGAGGRALELAESESRQSTATGMQDPAALSRQVQAGQYSRITEDDMTLTDEQKTALKALVDAGDLAGARKLMDGYEAEPTDEEKKDAPAAEAAAPAVAASAVTLTETEVKAQLAGSRLPAPSVRRIVEAGVHTAASLTAAIEAEVKYLKDLTSSGQPIQFQTAPAETGVATPVASQKQIAEAIAAINKRHMGR